MAAPKFTKSFLEFIAEEVFTTSRTNARQADKKAFNFYNGCTRKYILEAITKEFKKPETIEALSSRIIPLNILRKIILKSAGTYIESPLRAAGNKNEGDQEFLDDLQDAMRFNTRQKEANRYFKLFKRNLKELLVVKNKPACRNIPRHQFEVFSFSPDAPNTAELVVKVIKEEMERGDCVLDVWSDEQYARINGKGEVDKQFMNTLKNDKMINPYGVLPFVYITESSCSVDPISDDDLYNMSIAIPIVLTDLLFASKYQTFGILWTIGAVGDLPFNPNSVINMSVDEQGNRPEIGVVKPNLDSDKILDMVTFLLSSLLSTRGLSAGTIKASTSITDAISGVSKMLDSAENIEGRSDDMETFLAEEGETWEKLSKYLLPAWVKSKKLSSDFNRAFSKDFTAMVQLREPKVMLTEKELVETATAKIDAKLSTPKIELGKIYPDANAEELEKVWLEIEGYHSNDATINEINEQTIQD